MTALWRVALMTAIFWVVCMGFFCSAIVVGLRLCTGEVIVPWDFFWVFLCPISLLCSIEGAVKMLDDGVMFPWEH